MEMRDLILNAALGERDLMFVNNNDYSLAEGGLIAGMPTVKDYVALMEQRSEDFLLPLRKVTFKTKTDLIETEDGTNHQYSNIIMGHGDRDFALSSWGLGQICNTLGVPTAYIRKCIVDDAVGLGTDNLNYWKERVSDNFPDRNYLYRLTDNRLYGFLSSKYSIFDDSKFLGMIQSSIPSDAGSFVIKNRVVSPEITKLRIVANEKMIINGDEYSVAFDVANSRVGRSSVKVQFLLYRWICSNGMIMGGGIVEFFHRMHRNIEELSTASEIRALISNMPELLTNIKEWSEKSQSNKLNTQSLEMLTDNFKAKVLNSDQAISRIKTVMLEKYNNSMWGYTQAITEVAQQYSVFTREAMERYAGDLFTK